MTNLHYYHVFDEDFIHNFSLAYTEFGFLLNSQDEIRTNCIDFMRKENRFYHTAKEYVDDVVSFDNLGIGNFYGIFKIYLAFCSMLLIAFLIHSMANFILSRRRRIYFRIYLYFQKKYNS